MFHARFFNPTGAKPPIIGGVPQGSGTRRHVLRVQQVRQVVQAQAAAAAAPARALAAQALQLQGECTLHTRYTRSAHLADTRYVLGSLTVIKTRHVLYSNMHKTYRQLFY